jgi:hypothetical protein
VIPASKGHHEIHRRRTVVCIHVVFDQLFVHHGSAVGLPAGFPIGGSSTLSGDDNVYLSVFLGLLAGIHSARSALNPKSKKNKRETNARRAVGVVGNRLLTRSSHMLKL